MANNNQLELFTIPNPCIGVCQSNPRGYCIGCLRSRDERFNWHLKTAQEQRKIIQLVSQRKARLIQQQKQQRVANPESISTDSPAQNTLFDSPEDLKGQK
ncbi:MAG: DUF1289 domain-containing protein [Idiomarina sp.]|nr:DUF1289 domain-containing protein [Idiomarina sp.]